MISGNDGQTSVAKVLWLVGLMGSGAVEGLDDALSRLSVEL